MPSPRPPSDPPSASVPDGAIVAVEGGVLIRVQARPGARRSEVLGPYGDALRIGVASPPVDGRANEELCRFLADLLGVRNEDVEVIVGLAGRAKRVRVRGIGVVGAVARLGR